MPPPTGRRKPTSGCRSAGRRSSKPTLSARETFLPALVEHHAEGIAWGMLREQVAASDVSYRSEVLDILDRTPVWIYDAEGKIVDGRKKRLMDLQGGEPYRHMLEHFFPDLRNSSNTALYLCVEAKGPEKEQQRTVSGISGNGEAPRPDATGSADGSVSHATALPAESPMERISGPVHPFPKHVIGLHAGYCASWIASYGLSSSTRSGYEAGVTYRVGLSRRLPFYFRTGLTFVGKGYEINGFDDSRTTMSYLQIPVGIDYAVSLGRRWAVVARGGTLSCRRRGRQAQNRPGGGVRFRKSGRILASRHGDSRAAWTWHSVASASESLTKPD